MKPDDLFTILRNLLENAVRYSPKGGTVTVKLAQIEPPVLCVMDEGPGIPQEDRARVWNPSTVGSAPMYRVPAWVWPLLKRSVTGGNLT